MNTVFEVITKALLEPTDFFAKLINRWKLWTIFLKRYFLDVWLGSEDFSVFVDLSFGTTKVLLGQEQPQEMFCKKRCS